MLAGVDDGGLHASAPVGVFGVEDAEVDEGGEGGRVARSGELQQGLGWYRQPVASVAVGSFVFLAAAACLYAFGAALGLGFGQLFHDAGVVRPECFQQLRQPAERPGGEHVVGRLPGAEQDRHDQADHFPLAGLHAQCAADGLDEVGHGAAYVGEVDGVAVLGVDALAQHFH